MQLFSKIRKKSSYKSWGWDLTFFGEGGKSLVYSLWSLVFSLWSLVFSLWSLVFSLWLEMFFNFISTLE
jgi:hypothetical protein